MNYFNQQSKRLIFRPLTEDDIPKWESFFINNDRLKFLGLDLTKSPEEHSNEWIQKQSERYQKDGLGYLAAVTKDTNEFIGCGGILKKDFEGEIEYEIAYSLLPQFWGNGYATEIAIQLKEYCKSNINSERIISIIAIENFDSKKVAIKNGMESLFETTYKKMEVEVFGTYNK